MDEVGRRIPSNPPPAVAEWTEAITELRRQHRLNPRALAAETQRLYRQDAGRRSYSKSSWQRVLAGETLPPSWVAESLAARTGENAERWRDLIERAASELDQQQPTAQVPAVAAVPGPASADPAATTPGDDGTGVVLQVRGRNRRIAVIAVTLAVVVLVVIAVYVTTRIGGGSGARHSAAPTSAAAAGNEVFADTVPYRDAQAHLSLIRDHAGKLAARCEITSGTLRRRVRGCLIADQDGGQLTGTAAIEPPWPTWSNGRVRAQSTWIPCDASHAYSIGVVFDMGDLVHVEVASPQHASGC